MAGLSSKLLVYSDGSVRKEQAVTLPPRPPLFRVLHELEVPQVYWTTPVKMPEVRALFPAHFSDFGREWQLLSKAMNPRISANRWTSVYGYFAWIANGQGFGDESDPRANYVTGQDLTHENPRVECLTTGGSVVTGRVDGASLIIETLDVRSVPSLDWIMARPWYWTYAVTIDGNRTPRRFPQGLQPNGEVVPIIHPLIGNPGRYPEITIPLRRVERWTAEELPDPFTLYRPA
jgi:hypothetical protein